MAELKTHKVVSALPGTLEANSIYFVRAGTGFDQYVTNSGGTIIAYKANSIRGFVIAITGKTVAAEVYPGFAPYAFTSTTGRSFARAEIAATASTVFTIKRNGTSVATVTFAAAATVGTWSAGVTWVDGDFVTVEPPATPDATLSDIVLGARE